MPIGTGISRAEIDNTLAKIREFSAPKPVATTVKPTHPFQEFLSIAQKGLEAINTTQWSAESLKQRYLKGENNVSLTDVLVSSVQSRVALEGLLLVRNKFIEFYKDVMNMPV